MATSFKFYTDSGLTTELSGNLVFSQNSDDSTGDVTKVLYLGSTVAVDTLEAESDPGVDPIVISVNDSDPSASTPDETDVKLALSTGGLPGATPGADLNLPATISGGVAGAVAIYIRMTLPTAPDGTYTELSITTNEVQ
jgi:hypothetical protein